MQRNNVLKTPHHIESIAASNTFADNKALCYFKCEKDYELTSFWIKHQTGSLSYSSTDLCQRGVVCYYILVGRLRETGYPGQLTVIKGTNTDSKHLHANVVELLCVWNGLALSTVSLVSK